MGIYVKGLLGAFSGKVGNIVGSNWRSIDYLRSLPKPSRKPATAVQIAHRAKFALAIEFLSPLREVINIGFNDTGSKKMTAFNKATNELLKTIEGQYPDFIVPYNTVKFSKGSLGNVTAVIDKNMDGNTEVTWSPALTRLAAAADDVVHIILYQEEEQDYYVFQDATRIEGSYTIDPEGMGTGEFHVWILVISHDNKKRSNSKYYGTIEI